MLFWHGPEGNKSLASHTWVCPQATAFEPQPWTGRFTSLGLSFLTCKVGAARVTVPSAQGPCEDCLWRCMQSTQSMLASQIFYFSCRLNQPLGAKPRGGTPGPDLGLREGSCIHTCDLMDDERDEFVCVCVCTQVGMGERIQHLIRY